MLKNYDMIEYYLRTCDQDEVMNSLAWSGNLRAVQWAHTTTTRLVPIKATESIMTSLTWI